ncbi:MAG: hypothetical protein VXX39_04560 [Candidatus Thermoplasmatota archaeon]|nr:hypothetical protein [Candidatus Thermoplasmatota archaeon]
MQGRWLVSSLLLILVLPMFSGCLSLVTMREMMEQERGEPQVEVTKETHTIAHTFDWTGIDGVEYSNVSTFYVRDDVSEIVIYFRVAINSGGDCNGVLDRYVEATLTDATGEVVWSENVCEDHNPLNYHIYADPTLPNGEWTLDVNARGFGESFVNQVKDSFSVVVTVYKDCLEYPTENLCVDS